MDDGIHLIIVTGKGEIGRHSVWKLSAVTMKTNTWFWLLGQEIKIYRCSSMKLLLD